ncbi:hypothetical protein PDESU_04044 [Pontiella desulfatans]|uniref:Asl1-like glycosyl hydrolase catalytic domain-containing protein n=1 Tax=Pontiella desulfatans TaxID=2750659 RepID=A0A6C2U7G5_PONDE|nr:glycoside hydrolase family protein [Pontiella desulfatans]VGO15461.1 hypothetical protein PDESU_04044 [Pontiella desulfatans]
MRLESNRRAMLQAAACVVASSAAVRGAEEKPGKKGIGLELKSNPDWRKKLLGAKADWFYTWGATPPEPVVSSVEFVPMIWGQWSCNPEILKVLGEKGFDTVLGFNEPDQYNQAKLSVEDALRLWPILMESGIRLGSPACVHADGEWMDAFMKGVKKKGYRVDFIAMHSYMGDNVDFFLDRVEQIHRYYKKPIWITEFCVADWEACADRPNLYSQDKVLKFMETVLPQLEKRDYVERYAWYSSPYYYHPLNTSVLFNADGTANKLGDLYASI